ncbi:hypothetical protein VCRA2110O1_330024 [Vibrio crassostreae]|nr:hypothetical protein VCRA2110O1_330024 [Vibrio crassostreae]CAK2789526.1 hypothetical protein VCRA2110O3_310025 [Vibrio crassostreae]CAK2809749.1 hypothetical protein VCRA2110O2_320027 [Vibrio crassostreae]CAK3476416.1 hypothetical protein VCRA2126E14_290025 [Vibrio crassostreae]
MGVLISSISKLSFCNLLLYKNFKIISYFLKISLYLKLT